MNGIGKGRRNVPSPLISGPLVKLDSHNLVLIRHSSIAGARNSEHIAAGPFSWQFLHIYLAKGKGCLACTRAPETLNKRLVHGFNVMTTYRLSGVQGNLRKADQQVGGSWDSY